MDLQTKKEKLKSIIGEYQKVAVAFSGGVDSTFLLAVAHEVLKDNVMAITGVSPIHPEGEIQKAVSLAQKLGVRHIVHATGEMRLPDFVKNSKDRCYICKRQLILDMDKIAAENGIRIIAHGANLDDLTDYRPGFKAAEELGVVSPLIEAGLTKSEIRMLSKEMGLETWDKPAQPCLATRLPYGTPITEKAIAMVAEAEKVLMGMGIQVCRVRHHGDIARIEVLPEDIETIINVEKRRLIMDKFRQIGYLYIALDLAGYEQGSMNRGLS